MKRIPFGVRTGQLRLAALMYGTEHVIVGQEIVEVHGLDSDTDAAYRLRIALQLNLRVDNAKFHAPDHCTPTQDPPIGGNPGRFTRRE